MNDLYMDRYIGRWIDKTEYCLHVDRSMIRQPDTRMDKERHRENDVRTDIKVASQRYKFVQINRIWKDGKKDR